MDQDPLQYVKDIQNLSWKDLGYKTGMSRMLGGQQGQTFLNGSDMDAYFEDGGFQGSKIQSISANRIIASQLIATVNVGGGDPRTYLAMNASKQRFESFVDGVCQIIIGNPNP